MGHVRARQRCHGESRGCKSTAALLLKAANGVGQLLAEL